MLTQGYINLMTDGLCFADRPPEALLRPALPVLAVCCHPERPAPLRLACFTQLCRLVGACEPTALMPLLHTVTDGTPAAGVTLKGELECARSGWDFGPLGSSAVAAAFDTLVWWLLVLGAFWAI